MGMGWRAIAPCLAAGVIIAIESLACVPQQLPALWVAAECKVAAERTSALRPQVAVVASVNRDVMLLRVGQVRGGPRRVPAAGGVTRRLHRASL